jgi:GntR family transcriptional regulator
MIFNNDKAIYVQMADRLCDEILAGKYNADDRIPSVREYAVMLEVNTNTAVKAYDLLAREEIIYNKRGLGLLRFARRARRNHGLAQERVHRDRRCPTCSDRCDLLDIDIQDVQKEWEKQ